VDPPHTNGPSSFHQQYVLGHRIGRGGFAQVLCAQDSRSHRNVAVKVLSARREMAANEIKLLKQVSASEHCITLLDSYIESDLCYMVMELCDAPLLATLAKLKVYTERTLVPFTIGMLSAVAHVHHLGIVHRDIKPDNFLCTGPTCTVKLCDFGVAKQLSCPTDESFTGISGTAAFLSPEMLQGRRYGTKTDMWSFGVMMYILFFGQSPYSDKTGGSAAMKQAIKSGSPLPSFCLSPQLKQAGSAPVSRRAEDFTKALLVRDPQWRLTADAALQSPYLLEVGSFVDAPSLKPTLHAVEKMRELRAEDDPPDVDAVGRRLAALQAHYHADQSTQSGRDSSFSSSSSGHRSARTASGGSRGHADSPRSAQTGSTCDTGFSAVFPSKSGKRPMGCS